MSSISIEQASKQKTLYSGDWGSAEMEFAQGIMNEFKAGSLRIENREKRVTLRGYIAERLGCGEKRVSKKVGTKGHLGTIVPIICWSRAHRLSS